LKVLVLVPHGILASVACWLWWPKSEKGWRRFGFVVAYVPCMAGAYQFCDALRRNVASIANDVKKRLH